MVDYKSGVVPDANKRTFHVSEIRWFNLGCIVVPTSSVAPSVIFLNTNTSSSVVAGWFQMMLINKRVIHVSEIG